jgi:hypothetical protein
VSNIAAGREIRKPRPHDVQMSTCDEFGVMLVVGWDFRFATILKYSR